VSECERQRERERGTLSLSFFPSPSLPPSLFISLSSIANSHRPSLAPSQFDERRASRAMKLFFIQASPFTIITLFMAWYSFDAILQARAPGVGMGGAGGGPSGLGDPGSDLRAVCQVSTAVDAVANF
jgi:hypothetical protein